MEIDNSGIGKKITVIIPFLNEGEDLIETCKSVRSTGKDLVDIITVDDCSSDGLDYKALLEPYDVHYIRTKERVNAAKAKQLGTDFCKTPYVFFLDAHSRLYTSNWVEQAVQGLEENPNTVFCCSFQPFWKNLPENKEIKTFYGAYFSKLQLAEFVASCLTFNSSILPKKEDLFFPVPVIIGGNYMCSLEYFKYLGRFDGLLGFGFEEEFLSLKSYLSGGNCKCFSNILTGHLDASNYNPNRKTYTTKLYTDYNFLSLAYICFSEENFETVKQFLRKYFGDVRYSKVQKLFESRLWILDSFRSRFKDIKILSEDYYFDQINRRFYKNLRFLR